MKFLLILIIILFLVSLVSATKLGISPGNLIFNGSINEKICRNITINTDYKGILIGESKWIKEVKEKKDIKDYNLNQEDLGINLDYPTEINISENNEIISVCITANKIGKYNGAIIYKTNGGYAGVGSWIEIDIKNNNKTSGSIPITGFFSGIKQNNEINSNLSLVSSIVFIMLTIMLLVLLFVYKKVIKEKI